jgi:hypothetical protein
MDLTGSHDVHRYEKDAHSNSRFAIEVNGRSLGAFRRQIRSDNPNLD